jgi:hypothetical protein
VQLKNRIHASLIAFGHECPTSDLFGVSGRELRAELCFPSRAASIELIDFVNDQIAHIEQDLRRQGPTHPYVPC